MAKTHNQQPDVQPRASSEKPGFWRAFFSAMAAAFGVQSDKNRQADFNQSSPLPYILAGIVFTVLFIGVLVLIVKLALA